MADFVNGLKSANDYINNTNISIPTNITGDLGTGAISAQMASFSVKELVCGILAGNGIKLPNLQLCLKINLSQLLPILPAALDALKGALNAAIKALDDFLEHTGINALFNRLNGAIAEFAAIANMINFCGTPVLPRPIPNVLADMMGSYTGAGMDILNQLGQIADSDIGGCVSTQGGVNFGIFTGGSIKDIGDLIEGIQAGTISNVQERIDSINAQLNNFVKDIGELIEFENNYKSRMVEPQYTTVDDTGALIVAGGTGGSTFVPVDRINKKVGVYKDPNMSVAEASIAASSLQATYNQLSRYIIDDEGNTIFDYILEPELIAKLEQNVDPEPVVTEQQPVYDYCGKIIGYTTSVVSGSTESSSGSPVTQSNQPGTLTSVETDQTATITALQAQIEALIARLDALEGN